MSLVPPFYPLNARLGALYGPLVLCLLLPLAHHVFVIESNVTINLKPLCVRNGWNLGPSIIKGLTVVQEECVHSSWTTLMMETANFSGTMGTVCQSTSH